MIASVNEDFEKSRGKSQGYPSDLRYVVTKTADNSLELCIEDVEKGSNIWKMADPWGFAALAAAQKKLNAQPGLRFALRKPSDSEKPRFEAFKRRLSYLAAVNNISIILTAGARDERLYTLGELKDRKGEVVRTNFRDRSDDDTPGRLEKDFQTYLFGKGLYEDGAADGRTNERLALLGPDFIGIGNKGYLVEREFPTGAFFGEVKENNRILPTEYIDLVTVNKSGEIALIELKFEDKPLEAISQLLNYALFFYSYKTQLMPLLDKRLHCGRGELEFKAYLVSNVFHGGLESVWPFYSHDAIAMKRVIMGYMPEPVSQ